MWWGKCNQSLGTLEKKIKKLVEELDFEQAIVLRDEMLKLKELLLDF